MIDFRLVAGIAVIAILSAGAADGQTAVKTIKVQPAETTVTQGTDGTTMVTRRPFEKAPAPMTFTPPPLNSLMNAPAQDAAGFVPPPTRTTPPPSVTQTQPAAPAAPPVAQTEAAPPGVTPARRPVRAAARSAKQKPAMRMASRAKPAVVPRGYVASRRAAPRVHVAARPAVRTARPLRLASAPVLDAVQRQYIYRAIVEQQTLPQTAIPFADPDAVVPAVVAATEIVARRTRRPIAYTVGSRLPIDVPLIAMPEAATEHMQWLARYSYAIVNDRVLLVDPDSGVVVADMTQ